MIHKIYNALLMMCMGVAVLQAQPNLNYYWKGGSGNFNDPSMWWVNSYNSGQTASQSPVSSNNVYFTAAAFPTTGAVVSITADANCKDMIWDNTITRTPSMVAATSINISIFGSLELATDMGWNVSGNINFKAASGVVGILSRGNIFKLLNLNIELGATAELRLLDNLTIENPTMSNTTRLQGWLSLTSGHFNTNKKRLAADYISSTSGISNRRLTIDSSTIVVDGYNDNVWNVVFSGTNFAGFSAAGSHLRVQSTLNNTSSKNLGFGTSATTLYDTISIEQSLTRLYITNQTLNCNVLNLQEGLTPLVLNGATITTNILRLSPNVSIVGQNTNRITVDSIISPASCQLATLQTERGTFTLRKKNVGTLTFSNVALSGITADLTGGRTYAATSCTDLGANTGFTITAPVGCPTDLWFRGATADWHTLTNWRDALGNVPTALPTLLTNVYFDNLSFSTAVPNLSINKHAYCRDMRWAGTRATSRIALGTGLLFVNGTVDFPANMGGITGGVSAHELGRSLILYGNNDSLITRGVSIAGYIYFNKAADYTIVDTITTAGLYQYAGSTLRATNVGARITTHYIMGRRIFDNARLYFTGSGWNTTSGIDNSLVQYTNNSIFYFNGTGSQMVSGIVPNVVVNNTLFFINTSLTVQGNMTFNVSSQTSMQVYNTTTTGNQLTISGDLNLAQGVEVVWRDAANSNSVVVNGNLNMVGTCNKITTMRTYSGNAIPLAVSGTRNVQYAYLQGMNATNSINAINSIDGGSNTNITFATTTGTTYFWRANKNAPTNFVGNWTDPNYWTTDSTKLVGDGTCIPTANDDVVFDNRSFSGTSNSCVIDANALCRNFTCRDAIRINRTAVGVGNLFVGGSFTLHPSVIWSHAGYIYMVGSGNINTAGITLHIREFVLNNPVGTWTLQNNFQLGGIAINSEQYGVLRLTAGTFNTNNYAVTLDNRFESSGTQARSLQLGSTIWTMNMLGTYRYRNGTSYFPWNTEVSTNMGIVGGVIRFMDGTLRPDGKRLQLGSLTYQRIEIYDTNEEIQLYGNATFRYAHLAAGMYVNGNNTFDSLYLEGGNTYKFRAGAIQTLTSPNGRIISGGTASDFVFIESATPGSQSTFHKGYGDAFCIDYIKVKDMHGTRLATASVPPAYQPIQPFLLFQTGVYSDNINGTATGIWAFNLPPLEQPRYAGSNQIDICKVSEPMYASLPMLGTAPYLIQYTWNNGVTTGTGSITVDDLDNNPNTPQFANLPITSPTSSMTYTIDVSTMRCAQPTPSSVHTIQISAPAPNVLVSVNRTATCEFSNDSIWYTMVDDIDEKPVVGLLDKVSAADLSALGVVNTNVYFDPTIQYYNYMGASYPYLRRHWKIEPTNNGGARVRLYFTQAELNELVPLTYIGRQRGNLNIATDIQVFKFSSGTIGVGVHSIIPHTVVSLTGANAAGFSATTNVLAIEFEVASFSHFIIVPKNEALLPLAVEKFEAEAVDNKIVRTQWEMTQDQDIAYYTVERSVDAIQAEAAGEVVARQQTTAVAYTFIDQQPYQGVSYYRIKAHKIDGTVEFSDWRKVEITNGNNVVLYPNPANETLNIDLRTSAQTVTIRIVDVLGRVVHTTYWDSMQSNILQINTQALESGIYTVQVEYDSYTTQQKRVVIQH